MTSPRPWRRSGPSRRRGGFAVGHHLQARALLQPDTSRWPPPGCAEFGVLRFPAATCLNASRSFAGRSRLRCGRREGWAPLAVSLVTCVLLLSVPNGTRAAAALPIGGEPIHCAGPLQPPPCPTRKPVRRAAREDRPGLLAERARETPDALAYRAKHSASTASAPGATTRPWWRPAPRPAELGLARGAAGADGRRLRGVDDRRPRRAGGRRDQLRHLPDRSARSSTTR